MYSHHCDPHHDIHSHHYDPHHDDDKEEDVGEQCSGGEGEEAVAKK